MGPSQKFVNFTLLLPTFCPPILPTFCPPIADQFIDGVLNLVQRWFGTSLELSLKMVQNQFRTNSEPSSEPHSKMVQNSLYLT
jgi:hypothetical protein